MKRTQDEQVSHETEATEFKLELPEAIDTKPSWVIDLPRNKQALVYEVLVDKWVGDRHASQGTMINATMYDLYIVSKKTGSTQNTRSEVCNYRTHNRFESMPALKHHLMDLSAHLAIKRRSSIKKVRVENLVEEDDDDE